MPVLRLDSEGRFLASLATGLSGGVLSGLFGAGGGVILLPLLRVILGLRQHQAQGVTLAALMLPSGLPAMLHYHRQGIGIPWALVAAMILGFLPGVWAGALFAEKVPDGPLRWVFVSFLILLAAWTAFFHPQAELSLPPPCPALDKGCLVGLAGGIGSGLFGIGGGVIIIPMLALWLRLPQHQAQLISLVVMTFPIRLPGLLVYAHGWRPFPWVILYGLAVGFAFGTYLGARLATHIPGARLKGAFAGLMVVTAGMMIWRG